MVIRCLVNKSLSSLIFKAGAHNSLEHFYLSPEARRHQDISKFPIQKSLVSRPLIVPSTGSPRARKLATPPATVSRAVTKEIEYPAVVSLTRLSLFYPPRHHPPSMDRDIISRGKKFLMTENLIYIASSRRFRRRSASSFSCN